MLDLAERLLLAALDRILDGAAPCPVFFALEHGGERCAELLDQTVKPVLQLKPDAGRHLERERLVRGLEVVDIAPVGGDGLGGREVAQHATHHRMLADAGRAEREHVVAGAPHAGGEAHRAHRAILAEHADHLVKLGGGAERQIARVGHAIEQLRPDRRWRWDGGIGHDESSLVREAQLRVRIARRTSRETRAQPRMRSASG